MYTPKTISLITPYMLEPTASLLSYVVFIQASRLKCQSLILNSKKILLFLCKSKQFLIDGKNMIYIFIKISVQVCNLTNTTTKQKFIS